MSFDATQLLMSSPEDFHDILQKYQSGYKIHLVHSHSNITTGDQNAMSPEQLDSLIHFLHRMEDLRLYAQAQGIPVVEVKEEEGNLYDAVPGDHIVTAGCFGDQCVATHTQYLRDHEINAQRELDLCLIT